jgi:trehalose/maltose hydrolase-like predicted phosphorylase
MHSVDLDVGVPARGLHGEAYRGHIFWDELFIFPFLGLRLPELTRALLMYRYRRLPRARAAAAAEDYEGAMFPWQSGSDGREESQSLHLNPRSGRWVPDDTHRQRHVNAAIAYNIWRYYQVTGDMEFLSCYGAEMLLSIARFWASIASYNPDRERYDIHGVVGPDEFHTRYPGSHRTALSNNAYTNVMASWCLVRAAETLGMIGDDRRAELLEQLGISSTDLERWEEVGQRLFVPFSRDGIIEQFEGFEQLEELDWQGLAGKYGDIQRLDRVLEAEGDDPNRYKATKQADVLMLFFLLSSDELIHQLEHLGYPFEADAIPRNISYYLDRTSHGSSLSRVLHTWVAARSQRFDAWELFESSLATDLDDLQGGTTSEGIHLGAMASSLDLVQRGFTGLEARGDVLWFNPRLPQPIDCLELSFRYRGRWLELRLTHDSLRVRFQKSWSGLALVGFRGQVYKMDQGSERSFKLRDAGRRRRAAKSVSASESRKSQSRAPASPRLPAKD